MDSAHAQISHLYVALFGRAPDAEGLAFWTSLLASGQTTVQIADAMFGTAPARAYFPSGLSNQEIIASFYANVLGRTADATGLAFWTAKLNQPGATPGLVIGEMIDVVAHYDGTNSDGLTSAALFNNRSAAALFYGENGGGLANATSVLSGVTKDAQTVFEARVFETPDYASGSMDVGGFGKIAVGTLQGNIVLVNAAHDVELHVEQNLNFHAITLQLRDPGGTNDHLVVYPHMDPLAQNNINYLNLKLEGFEHLSLALLPSTQGALHDVYLYHMHLESVTVIGKADQVLLSFADIDYVDASAFDGDLSSETNGVTRVIGSAGADRLSAHGTGGTVEAGTGNDVLHGGGAVTLFGGPGSDVFTPVSVDAPPLIGDFEPGSDTLNLVLRVYNHAPGSGVANYGTWYSEGVVLGEDANLQAYLNAAASQKPASTYAAITWFRYGSDSYVVVDNNSADTTFHIYDSVIKLAGVTDLSSLTYDSLTAELH